MKPIGNDWNEWKREDEVEIVEVHWVELNTAENSNFKFAPSNCSKTFQARQGHLFEAEEI